MTQPIDPAFQAAIQRITHSAPIESRRDTLPVGTHEVAICRYQAVANQGAPGQNNANNGYRLESTWLIVNSDQPNITPNTVVKDWTWFPDASGWRGTYEGARAHEFLKAGRDGLGAQGAILEENLPPYNDEQERERLIAGRVGDKLYTGEFRGMRWRVVVTPVLNEDGTQRMTKPKGNAKPKPLRNAEFSPIQQTLNDVAVWKTYLETSFSSACKLVTPKQQQGGGQFAQAPHPAQMQNQYPQYAQQAPAPAPQQYPQQPQYVQQSMQPGPAQFAPQQQAPMPAPSQPGYGPGPSGWPVQQPSVAPAQPQYTQQAPQQFVPGSVQSTPQGPQMTAPQGPTFPHAPMPGMSAMPGAPGAPPFNTNPITSAPALSALGPLMNTLRQQ